jgi:predicted transcriptional regulator
MGNIVGLDLNIDQNYLENAVQQTVIMGIAEALNGKNEITSQIVKCVLSQRVSEKGTVSTYDRDNKYSLLEFYVRKALEEETRAVLKQMVEEKRPEIHEMIRKELSKKTTLNKFCNSFIDAVQGSLDNYYRTKIEVLFDKPKDTNY